MKKVIVTLTDLNRTFFYDLEIPVNVPVKKLKKDICETLHNYNNTYLNSDGIELFCNRMGMGLPGEETFESIGIWNGDYITVIEV